MITFVRIQVRKPLRKWHQSVYGSKNTFRAMVLKMRFGLWFQKCVFIIRCCFRFRFRANGITHDYRTLGFCRFRICANGISQLVISTDFNIKKLNRRRRKVKIQYISETILILCMVIPTNSAKTQKQHGELSSMKL